ncbi:unannotated protein [freshwater metagenome]|uniref:Unannotated protein n=1 Tax=freshwater metagenome TaxID=449393 RepID=A0A6J6YCZ0_9ZZZZ
MLSVSMPKSLTPAALVDTATKCLLTADPSPCAPRPASNQSRAVEALVMVSIVVKVFDETTNSVLAGSRSARFWAISAPSTLLTNRHSMSACL